MIYHKPRSGRDLSQAPFEPGEIGLLHTGHDLDLAIQDLEERAVRLRDLIEQEEIMSEEYRRMAEESRGHLLGARDQVAVFLDDVHASLSELEQARAMVCLRAMTVQAGPEGGESPANTEEIDYEVLLDSLEEDLKVIHTIPLIQVKAALEKWVEAINREVEMLFKTGTLRKVDLQEVRKLEQQRKVLMVPAKCVFTMKPPAVPGTRVKRKCRIVICGNYIPSGSSDICLYASGASSDALRVALVIAARFSWMGAISDIASAFLLAPWPPELPRYAIQPPRVVRDSGAASSTEGWIIDRALYGLRESPAVWGNFRSRRLKSARIQFGRVVLKLIPTVAESELWLVRDEQTNQLYGLLVTYVDDLFYFGEEQIIRALHKFILEEWPASELEWVNEEVAVRYLGVEILKCPGAMGFTISQQAYIQELLRSYELQDVHPTHLPAPREWVEAAESQDELEEFEEQDLRRAQRHVGEALWLATRTRPDIMFLVNHMSSLVSRRPLYVHRLALRLLAYLSGTADMKLQLGGRGTDDKEVKVYTDASYAPFGKRSFGAAVVTVENSTVAWKAARQSFITLSVMEAELYAATQGCLLLDAIHALIEEILPGEFDKILAIDNTSAEAMLAGGPGSQRTRHLKIRANYIREAVQEGRMRVTHVAGQDQLADLATKMQPRLRLHQLLRLWGFMGSCLVETMQIMKLRVLMILAMLSSLACPSRAQPVNDKEPVKTTGWDELAVLLAISCLFTVVVWELMKCVLVRVYKFLKAQRKAKKIHEIGDVAARAAREAIREQMMMRHSRSPTSAATKIQEPRSSSPVEDTSSTTPTMRRRSLEQVGMRSSPVKVNNTSSATNVLDEDSDERGRVARDMLDLLTVEELKVGLRYEMLAVSGLKRDLVARLAMRLATEDRSDHRVLPTIKQMKYVLYLWRARDLSGRARITWANVNNRSRISMWIDSWKRG